MKRHTLVHELGHAVIAALQSDTPAGISTDASLGGVAQTRTTASGDTVAVRIAGPAAELSFTMTTAATGENREMLAGAPGSAVAKMLAINRIPSAGSDLQGIDLDALTVQEHGVLQLVWSMAHHMATDPGFGRWADDLAKLLDAGYTALIRREDAIGLLRGDLPLLQLAEPEVSSGIDWLEGSEDLPADVRAMAERLMTGATVN